ncbi:hypothetical protein PMAYCL1PPCAC_31198 [Pristionchus mayeri]|uniref:Lin-14 n=1 Tax=Pristionchus mayeri TaxID=1317129 RepID=A0AAN5ICE1_9BILA|nr:hypothetical protein PMAYCL1PPCAC_31198 [Pristionchus mayeri]
MLNTASVNSPVLHHAPHEVKHHRPAQQNSLSSLVYADARAAAIHKLQHLQLMQLQQHHAEQQQLLGSEASVSPMLQESSYGLDLGRVSKPESAVSPPTPSGSSVPSTSSSTSTSPSSSTSSSSKDDHMKDSLVEELMKAPQQAHSAIQKIHKGQRISGMDQDAFVRARKIKSPCSAFAEVAEIKLIVYQLLLAPTTPQLGTSPLAGIQALLQAGLNGDSQPMHNNNNGLNNSRKRSANFGGGPTQPEQPVALRPAIGNCGLNTTGFMPPGWSGSTPWSHFLNGGMRTSPTLPGAAPTTETASAGDGTQKLWSSPSSVESGHKPESNAGDSNIDPVGMESDGSPSSTCTQSPTDVLAYAAGLTPATLNSAMNQVNGVHERKPRKQISDDYVKLIRQQHEMSGRNISDIQIPVPEALECDPQFVAIPEKQIVDQIVQSKKFDEMNPKDVQETATQLCKKLAEKRVFGSRLMAQTTVAGPNHSTYNNLPDEGILYIHHVCRTVLKDKLKNDDEFWDVFREAMRKLAARCRRVRHAKKTKIMKESGGGVTPLAQDVSNNLAGTFFNQGPAQLMELLKKNMPGAGHELSPSNGFAALQQQAFQLAEAQRALAKSESPEEEEQPQHSPPAPAVKSEQLDWEELSRRIQAATSSAPSTATSPVMPIHDISAQLAKAMPNSFQGVFQDA